LKVGKPIKYTQEERLRLLAELEEYLEKENYPSVCGFCVKHKIAKQRIYEWANDTKLNAKSKPLGEYFSDLIQRIHEKQEDYIERNTLLGDIPPSFAQFKLKQPCIGWVDKTEQLMKGDMKISIGLPQEFADGD